MMEAMENVIVRENEGPQMPLPPVAPTDFTVVIGAVLAGRTEQEFREGLEALGGWRRAMASS